MSETFIKAIKDKHFNDADLRKAIVGYFTPRLEDEVARQCTAGVLDDEFTDPFAMAVLLMEMIEEEYTALLVRSSREIARLFGDANIQFRLDNITTVIHEKYRVVLLWRINNTDYVIDYCFNPDLEIPFSTLYKTGRINSCGDIIAGDMLHETYQIINCNSVLPRWFVFGLSPNS